MKKQERPPPPGLKVGGMSEEEEVSEILNA